MKYNGLKENEILQAREKYGDNSLPEKEKETFWQLFLESFKDPMILLLLGITLLMSVLAIMGVSDWSEIVGIVAAILVVTLVSTKTSMSSALEYDKLKNSVEKPKCKVIRNGQVKEIYFNDVVKGDLIILQSGDKVPADGTLIDGDISVNNAALNGEPDECKKVSVEKVDLINDMIPENITGDTFVDKHSLFRNAVVVDGEGIFKVEKVGTNTEMGKMAEELNVEEVESPLTVKLTKLAKDISTFGYIGAIVIGLAYMLQNIITNGGFSAYFDIGLINVFKDFLEAMLLSVVIVVMAVPEGLPLMIAIVLMRNTSKMLQKNVLVRKSIGIETAGSLNILFSDKTGTITKGQLEVVEFFDGDVKNTYKTSSKIKELVEQAIYKNTAAMFDGDGQVVGGNATDKALLHFLNKDEVKKYDDVEIIKTQQFNSTNKYSASELKDKTVFKGAPERLLSKATKYINENGEIVDIDKEKINAKIDELANRAMRVLAFGYSESKLEEDILPEDLVIIGFVGIRDEVRPSSKKAIARVQKAGVQVVMITGDRKETAVAIAKESGLIKNDTDLAFTSEELNKMTDDEVKAVLKDIRVIARALPTDKSRMVRLSQELNLVCGMTGDGVNDSPALRRADVGFAMGSGTDVAKEVSEIIILDDNFESIANAILYGRTIYNNILKFITFQLTINVSAVLISAVGPFVGVEEPLSITHILWINLIMDGLAALALGSEPALDKYMLEKPKSRTQSIVDKHMLTRVMYCALWIFGTGLVFLKAPFVKEFFTTDLELRTGYFSFFVLSAVFNGFNVRSKGINLFEHIEGNKDFLKVMGIIVIVQILITFVGGSLFNCTPLNLTQWILIIISSLLVIPIDLLRKIITGNIK